MKSLLLFILMVLLLSPLNAAAMRVGGIDMPERKNSLELKGAGLLRKGFVFKVYAGALYASGSDKTEWINGETARQIDIHFFHHTPTKYMVREAEKTLRKNLTPEEYERHRDSLEKLHAALILGKKGSVASLLHIPGEGLSYRFDGRLITTIPDDQFAIAYFKIWLGENPSSKTMKRALLKSYNE